MSVVSNLRPLSVGELLDRAFRLYRAQFLKFTGIVALPLIPMALLQIWSLSSFGTSGLVDLGQQLFIQPLISAVLSVAISEAYLWEPVSIGEAYRRGSRRYWRLLAASFLIGLAIGGPAVLLGICVSLVTMGMGLLIFVIIIPLAAYLGTRWGMFTPAVVLEEEGAVDGLRRSWHLTEGHFWRVFGTSVLAGVLTLILAQLPAEVVTYAISSTASLELAAILSTVVSQLSLVITMPFSLAVTTLLYYDLRVRKEGYDLELQADAIITSPEDEPSL